MTRSWIAAGVLFFLLVADACPCTIISGETMDGVVWVGNNEDYVFFFDTYLNVLPREAGLRGAVSFTYGSPDSFIQGGFNEDGLFFDFNALPEIPTSERKDWGKRRSFPGGDRAFVEHLLRKCSTVREVVDLVTTYDFELTQAQIHVADKRGNFAVINEAGVRVEDRDFQVSTNFNVCFADAPERTFCWRYPLANRMLSERQASLETMRDVLEATQQPQIAGTIYSNVINLTTGESYNYYAGDFRHSYHFRLNNLLREGRRSYLWRSLFPDAPVVRIWETYLSEGRDAALDLYRQLRDDIPPQRKSEVLRHVFSCLLLRESRYADAAAFFDQWLQDGGGQDTMTDLYQGVVCLTNGDVEEAGERFRAQVAIDESCEEKRHWRPSLAKELLERLDGKGPPGANARLELKGHGDAQFVCVVVADGIPIRNFLVKTEDGWAADFKLPKGKNHYVFVVDGQVVLDPENPVREEVETVNGKRTRNVLFAE